jgi:drug/metabolite transporter (DMT)-like permease
VSGGSLDAAPQATRGGRDLPGAGFILLAAAFFATLGPLSEFADRAGVSSLSLVTWRAGLGALCVILIVAARMALGQRTRMVSLRSLPARDRWFMAGAAVANTILNLGAFIAFQRIGITLTLLVFYLYPAMVAVVSVLWFGERLDRLRWSALAMSMVGSVLVVAGAGQFGTVDLLGIGLAALGGIGQTFYVLAARHGFARVPGAQAAIITMSGAAALYVVIALVLGSVGTLVQPLAGLGSLWPVLMAGVVGAGLPTVLYIVGIRRLGPPRASILATFEPLVGVALAAVLLAERPAVLQLLGGALIIVAGIVLQLRPNADVADHEALGDAD